MLSDLLWMIILACLMLIGLTRPYIALCAVIFIDVLKPQDLSYGFLIGKPLSLIATLAFFASMAFNFKEISFPRKKLPATILVIFMIWITVTTIYSEFQLSAWFKHDYSIKTIFFAFFIPFVINTRLKLETFIMILISCIGYFAMVGGMKTMFGMTGYGMQLIDTRVGNSGITESSSLSMVMAFTLPFIYFLLKHSIFVKKNKLFKPILIALALACVLTLIGTHARTGLVGLFILFVLIFWRSKHKAKILLFSGVLVLTTIPFISQDWLNRMNTIGTASEDSSAYGRVIVWRWTLDYVKERPIMGGGFMSYQANAGVLHLYNETEVNVNYHNKSGKAFHNMLFEVLGEHGYVGLLLYLMMIFLTWRIGLQALKHSPEDTWVADLMQTNNRALLVYCACGMFIAVAFSPWLFYFLGISVSMNNILYLEQKQLLH